MNNILPTPLASILKPLGFSIADIFTSVSEYSAWLIIIMTMQTQQTTALLLLYTFLANWLAFPAHYAKAWLFRRSWCYFSYCSFLMVTQCQYFYNLIANTVGFRSPLHRYRTGTGMAHSYVHYSFTPGFLVFFTVSFFSILNWSVPCSRMRPWDTNKANSSSNKVFDVEQSAAVQGRHWKDSEKAHESTQN